MALIVDPASVAACEQAGVGASVDLQLGGWGDPVYSGGPLEVTAYVRMLSDGQYVHKGAISNGALIKCGKTAVVEVAGNIVIVTSIPFQPLDLEIFRRHGIAPEDQKFLIAKSAVHYRASYGTIAREMVGIALPGYCPPTPETLIYKNWKKHPETAMEE
jgi:microcystin degradation protein MlrC